MVRHAATVASFAVVFTTTTPALAADPGGRAGILPAVGWHHRLPIERKAEA